MRKLGTPKELSEALNTDRDGVMAWAKEQARIETEKYKEDQEEKIRDLICGFFSSGQRFARG